MKGLKRILERLHHIRKDRKVLLISSESIQYLVLKFSEKVRTYISLLQEGKDPGELKAEIALLVEIIKLIKSTGSVLIDEIDTVLDVLKSVHFTVSESKPINPILAATCGDLYRMLVNSPDIHTQMDFKFKLLSDQQYVEPFEAAVYHEKVKPKIIQAIMEGKFKSSETEWTKFFDGLKPKQKALIKRYLEDDLGADVLAFTNSIPEPIQDVLATLKEQIQVLFPLTLEQNLFEHYGPSLADKGPEQGIAVPYQKGRAPPKGTQHGTDLESWNYTLHMYLQTGFTAKVIKKLLLEVQDDVITKLAKTGSIISFQ
jgi:hypothetical protein